MVPEEPAETYPTIPPEALSALGLAKAALAAFVMVEFLTTQSETVTAPLIAPIIPPEKREFRYAESTQRFLTLPFFIMGISALFTAASLPSP